MPPLTSSPSSPRQLLVARKHPWQRTQQWTAMLTLLALVILTTTHHAHALSTPPITPRAVTQGHVDAFHVSYAAGQVRLDLREDSTGHLLTHAPEDVVLHLPAAALWQPSSDTTLPIPLPAYVLPDVQDPHLIWPGWNTSELGGTPFTSTSLHLSAVRGPGRVHLFGLDPLTAALVPLLHHRGTSLPGTIAMAQHGHQHAWWAFEKKGIYQLEVSVEARTATTTHSSRTHTYTFAVDSPTPAPVSPPPTSQLTMPPLPTTLLSSAPALPAPDASSTTTPPLSPTSAAGAAPTTVSTAVPTVTLSEGHLDVFHLSPHPNGPLLRLKDDTVAGRSTLRIPSSTVIHVPERARRALPRSVPGGHHDRPYVLPLTQAPGVVWPGWNTEALATQKDPSASIVIESVRASAAGGAIHLFSSRAGTAVPVLTGGSVTLPGTITVPRPSHVHANWVFTRAGTYDLVARAVVGGRRSAPERYRFVVGGPASQRSPHGVTSWSPSNAHSSPSTRPHAAAAAFRHTPAVTARPATTAPTDPDCAPVANTVTPSAGASVSAAERAATEEVTDGHLDLGGMINGQRLVASVKDDRATPSRWRNPEELTFRLGAAARTASAPAELRFLTPPGTPYWSMDSTQKPGVPWLGWNTTHPSLAAHSPGTITWTLDDVQGPGSLGIFLAGALGGGVGTRQLDTVGGPRSFTVPRNTHQHANWVFTQPGTYRLRLTASATGLQPSTTTLTFLIGDTARASRTTGRAETPTRPMSGRRPDGTPCTPGSSRLAMTGSDVRGALTAGLSLSALGGMCLWYGRRRREVTW